MKKVVIFIFLLLVFYSIYHLNTRPHYYRLRTLTKSEGVLNGYSIVYIKKMNCVLQLAKYYGFVHSDDNLNFYFPDTSSYGSAHSRSTIKRAYINSNINIFTFYDYDFSLDTKTKDLKPYYSSIDSFSYLSRRVKDTLIRNQLFRNNVFYIAPLSYVSEKDTFYLEFLLNIDYMQILYSKVYCKRTGYVSFEQSLYDFGESNKDTFMMSFLKGDEVELDYIL